jgi:hypothetical protein
VYSYRIKLENSAKDSVKILWPKNIHKALNTSNYISFSSIALCDSSVISIGCAGYIFYCHFFA